MLVRMTKTTKGSPNGIKVMEYKAGEQYNLPENLYHVFKKIGACQDVEVKAVSNAPQNKMAQVPENKVEKVEEIPEIEQEDIQEVEDKQSYKRRRR